jgi:hypothetical protein
MVRHISQNQKNKRFSRLQQIQKERSAARRASVATGEVSYPSCSRVILRNAWNRVVLEVAAERTVPSL